MQPMARDAPSLLREKISLGGRVRPERLDWAYPPHRIAKKYFFRGLKIVKMEHTLHCGRFGFEKMTAEDSRQYAGTEGRREEPALAPNEDIADRSFCNFFPFVHEESFVHAGRASFGMPLIVAFAARCFVAQQDVLRRSAL